MLHGPWKEANAPVVSLNVDDSNVNGEAIAIALAYLYGHHPQLNDNNAFRVLAAASFLDLQVLKKRLFLYKKIFNFDHFSVNELKFSFFNFWHLKLIAGSMCDMYGFYCI